MIPIARKESLVLQESNGELLVYDTRANKAICLNQTSALIWRFCDGERSPLEIRLAVQNELGSEISEDLIWFGLEQLYKEDLLANNDDFTDRYKGLSRREIVRKIGLTAVVSLPIVTSLVAPAAANAQSTCIPVMGGCVCDVTGMDGGGMGAPCSTDGIGTPGIPCASPNCTCVHGNQGNSHRGNCV